MHENRDDLIVEDGTMTVPIRKHAPPAEPEPEPEMPFDGFEEPAAKTGPDVTNRCAPEGIDPGDERYIGRPVQVDFETGAVTVLPESGS
jgi:hypothetical protein